jgi:nucleoside-diphosphate-sugar epimerase|tara:strand:+ start:1284 stop:2216 length:933 start_codon:yes stop_codon:yes gene_type:complete
LKILITGGAGYIGSVLTANLAALKHEVTILDNFYFKQDFVKSDLAKKNINIVNGDVRNEKLLLDLVKKNDAIIPLAALVGAPLCDLYPEDAVQINQESILSLRNILSKDQIVIFPVSNSGYGIGKKNELCTEESELNPISLYGKTKVLAEKIIMERENSIALRLATVFGISPRMRVDLLVNNFVYESLVKKHLKIFEGNFKRNYVHIDDVVNVFIFMINNFSKHKSNVFNFGLEDANLSKLELANKIKKYVTELVIEESEFGKDPDKRDYVVSNKKILSTGYTFKKNLDDGIKELVNGLLKPGTNLSTNV